MSSGSTCQKQVVHRSAGRYAVFAVEELSMGILLSSALDGLNLQIAQLSTAWLMSECRNRPEFSVT